MMPSLTTERAEHQLISDAIATLTEGGEGEKKRNELLLSMKQFVRFITIMSALRGKEIWMMTALPTRGLSF